MGQKEIKMAKVLFKVTTLDNNSCTVTKTRYNINYPDGQIVKAIPGTLGIMLFETREHAMRLRAIMEPRRMGSGKHKFEFKIKKVEPIGVGKRPTGVAPTREVTMDRFYNNSSSVSFVPPIGTICYQKVKVIGDNRG